ncbi:5-(carboxyamino)imidazole ribonucleotide synthase [Thermomicrobium sp. CFH 73360]|uniref:5-(carboxyamino)imidazole ribonucleotide synthase n=1 Tax=Thermomicrobium sp. CFH 73360 TaxID=2951987 RepID=UPI00207775E8|nr:5-(carboxyamino)imidazole ribonucleotide synthase [Thermomicrobium sp. CFH 73360]MCM8747125.1 5-(carboxyamino)imidazole ribonucleotide synthase [Thermomicrobium sp. CFH 73360]
MLIGILGGGQLGRMLALAGYPLGLRFRGLDPNANAPLGQVAELVVAPYDDRLALERFAAGLDLVTYEFENVPGSTAEFLAARLSVSPPPEALIRSQDRLEEKRLFEECGIPVPRYAPVSGPDDFAQALDAVPLPALLKTRRLGYDGRGQAQIHTAEELALAWERLGGVPCLLEEFVPFEYEVSLLGVRSRRGEITFYTLVENRHVEGILAISRAPAPRASTALQTLAQQYVAAILNRLEYVGVLAVEFFVVGDRLLANEMAPRVHNSGHWTIEGAETSQFEQHLRAILGWPLGSTTPRGHSAMINLLSVIPPIEPILGLPNTHVHLYGKEPRPRRKLGHITVRADSAHERDELLRQVLEFVSFP